MEGYFFHTTKSLRYFFIPQTKTKLGGLCRKAIDGRNSLRKYLKRTRQMAEEMLSQKRKVLEISEEEEKTEPMPEEEEQSQAEESDVLQDAYQLLEHYFSSDRERQYQFLLNLGRSIKSTLPKKTKKPRTK